MTAGNQADGRAQLFQPLRTAAFQRFAAGDYAGVLPFARRAEELFPEKGEVPFWLACVHAREGRPEAAVAALRAGLGRGLYWPRDWLLDDDDLAPLRGRPDFLELVSASDEAAAARAVAPPAALEPVVLEPGGGAAHGRPPLAEVVALHGWGQDADEFALHWQAAAGAGFRVIVPRSGQEPTPGFFVWDDRERALADVAAQARAAAILPSRPAPGIVAGFSQGGGIAVDLALDERPAAPAGFLAVSAGPEDLAGALTPERLQAAAARRVRGRLLAGERDDALDGARALARVLRDAGLCGELSVLRGLGHEMPEPPGEPLASELAGLLG
jgi:predicted esterase